jgi:PAS domain S-box-containing protein
MAAHKEYSPFPPQKNSAHLPRRDDGMTGSEVNSASRSSGDLASVSHNFNAHWRIELKQPVSIALDANEQIKAVRQQSFLADADDALAEMLGYQSQTGVVENSKNQVLFDCLFNDEILKAFIASGYRASGVSLDAHNLRGDPCHFLIDYFGIVKNNRLTQIWGIQRFGDQVVEKNYQHQNVIDSMLEHIAVLDREGNIVATNDAWNRFARKNCSPGSEQSVGLGSNYLKICLCEGEGESEGEKVYRGIKDVLENRADYFTLEYPCHEPNGEERWFLLHVTPLAETDGAVVSHLNITKRKTMERELAGALDKLQIAYNEAETSNRLKDEFLATVSHELRTPLTSILGWSKLLRSQNLDEKATIHGLETIERNAQAQSRLIDDLLDISRIVNGSIKLDFQPFDLNSAISRAIGSLQSLAKLKNISLEFETEINDAPVNADARRIEQIVWHLLSNAIKFTPQNGRVEVGLKKINSHFEIFVKDSGVGIETEFLPYVFDRFRQADGSTTRKHGGLGLGLAIVKHLAELHGGQVSADSPGAGLGATFYVRLPALKTDVQTAVENDFFLNRNFSFKQSRNSEKLNGVRLLVVDDDLDNLEFLKYLFEDHGAKVQAAGSVKEALEKFYDKKPDLIISDIGMPQHDGFYLIQKIRESNEPNGKSTPAIALTAYAKTEDRLQALESGFQRHLKKPADPSDLIETAVSLLLQRK